MNVLHAAEGIPFSGSVPEEEQHNGRMGPLSRAGVVLIALTQSLSDIKTTHATSFYCYPFRVLYPFFSGEI
ncbi:MAG: hypothetical protein DRP86_01525 [Candidatus Neomarinimicrobiota bacterium]|nr:MAG: hypothetical protein DRP86_01525 [Candidatus Neomarinimicrobiota bacterium]